MWKRVALILAIVILGALVERAVYDVAIRPRLADWQSIPTLWGALLVAPLLVAGIVARLAVRSW